VVGPWSVGEATQAEPLWTKLPDHSLTILDRGFRSYALLQRLATSGRKRHWLTAWLTPPGNLPPGSTVSIRSGSS